MDWNLQHRSANSRHVCVSGPLRASTGLQRNCQDCTPPALTPPLLRRLGSDAVCHAMSFTHHAQGCVTATFTPRAFGKSLSALNPACSLSGSLRCQQGLCFLSSCELPHKERYVRATSTFCWRLVFMKLCICPAWIGQQPPEVQFFRNPTF